MANVEDMEFFEPPINNEYPDMAALGHVQEMDIQREHDNGIHIRDEICHRISDE